MTASRIFQGIVPAILLLVGGAICGFALLAPYVGLGEQEQFFLFRNYGWPRRQVFEIGVMSLSAGAAIFIVYQITQVIQHRFGGTRAMTGLVVDRVNSYQSPLVRHIITALITLKGLMGKRWFQFSMAGALVVMYAGAEYQTRKISYENYINDSRLQTMLFYTESIGGGKVDQLLGINKPPSKIGIFKENSDITLIYLGQNAEVARRVDFHLNNFGLLSKRDYEVERTEPEFRILVLGNEQTAPTTAPLPWPEILNGLLNKDEEFVRRVGGKKINVINYGWPDAGFAHYPWVWKRARAFKPDMVLLNIADHDYKRVWKFGEIAKKRRKKVSRPTSVYALHDYSADVGFDRPILLWLRCLEKPYTLQNPKCTTSRPHTIFSPVELLENKQALRAVHKQIIEEYAGGVIWNTYYPLALMSLFSYSLNLSVYDHSLDPERLRGLYWPGTPPEKLDVPTSDDVMVDLAAKFLAEITDDFPNVLVTRNAWYSELASPEPTTYEKTRMLMKRSPSLDIRIMADHLPLDLGAKEIESWYLVPKDPVKWSDKGHRVYARAMAKVVKEYVEKRGL